MKRIVLKSAAVILLIAAGVYLYNQSGREKMESRPARTFSVMQNLIQRTAFAPSATRALFLCSNRGTGAGQWTIHCVELETGKTLYQITPPLYGVDLAYSPNGSVFAVLLHSGARADVGVFSAETGEQLQAIPGVEYLIDVRFSPIDDRLIFAGEENGQRFAEVWDWKKNQKIKRIPGAGGNLAVSADGNQILVGGPNPDKSDDKIRLWDVQSGKRLHEFPTGAPGGSQHFAITPDGSRIAAGRTPGITNVWDAHSGAHLYRLDPYPGEDQFGIAVTFSPDSQLLAVSYSPDRASMTGSSFWLLQQIQVWIARFLPPKTPIGPLKLWNAETGQLVRTYGINQLLATVAFTPDTSRMVTADMGGNVHWWDLEK